MARLVASETVIAGRIEICTALGLDASVTKGIVIEMHASDLAMLTVTQYLTEEQAQKLGVALKKLRLVQMHEVLDEMERERRLAPMAQAAPSHA